MCGRIFYNFLANRKILNKECVFLAKWLEQKPLFLFSGLTADL